MSLGCGTKTTGCCSRSPAGLFVVVVVVVGCWLVASAPVSAVAPLRRNGGGGTVAGPRHEPHPPRVSAWNRLPLVQSAFQSKSSLLQPVGKSVGRRFRHHHRQQQQQQQRSLRILLSLSVSSTLSPVVRQLRGGGVGASSSRSWVGAPIPSAATTTTSRLASLPSSNSNSIMAADDDTNSNSDSFSIGSSNTVAPFNVSLWDAGSTSMDDVYRTLNTTAASGGLTRAEAAVRAVYYGPNALDAAPSRSLLSLILDQFRDRLVQILVGVAVLSALFSWAEASSSLASIGSHHLHTDGNNNNAAAMWKSFVEPMVIVAILILNAGVGVWQSQSASDSLKALEDLQAAECTVLRNHNNDTDTGEQQQQQDTQGGGNIVPASILVPGDIVALRPGDKVPADGRLVSLTSSVLAVDEGSLTGESVTVFKLPGDEGRASAIDSPIPDQRGMLYAGTVVTQGTGTMVVTQTGMDTQFGRIQRGVLQAEPPKTPLQSKLDDFGSTLTVIIGAICLAVWIVSIPKMNDPSFSSVWDGAVYYAKVAVALGVAAIPEGLPAVITLCLSLGTRRMAQRNVIVRNLPSVETLGCTSVICTDKTGTLTTNEVSFFEACHEVFWYRMTVL